MTPPATKRPWSLGARLTAWYTLLTCALSLLTAVALYRGLVSSIEDQDDKFLADKLRVVQGFVERPDAKYEDLRQEVEEEWATRQLLQVYTRIIDQDGRLVTESPSMSLRLPPGLFPPPVPPDEDNPPGTDFHNAAGARFRGLTGHAVWRREPGHVYTVQVALDRGTQVTLERTYARWLALVSGAATFLAAAVGAYVARRGLRPVAEITRQIRNIRTSSLHERLDVTRLPAEIQSLAESFNQMLDRLQEAFTRLSEFSADIAHELRTPVHVLMSAVDVTLSRPRGVAEYREALGSCAEECARLSRMIDNLLFLARAEDPRAQIHRERVHVAHELDLIREFYEAPAADAGVALDADCPPALEADLDRLLFQRAVGNLVTNALRYTPRGGRVSVAARRDDGALLIEVADTGCGIPADQLPRVFDRLYRADRARTSTSTGAVGLGLSIVKGIASLHGGTAEIESHPGQGTRVRLRFPQPPGPASPPPAGPQPLASAAPRHGAAAGPSPLVPSPGTSGEG